MKSFWIALLLCLFSSVLCQDDDYCEEYPEYCDYYSDDYNDDDNDDDNDDGGGDDDGYPDYDCDEYPEYCDCDEYPEYCGGSEEVNTDSSTTTTSTTKKPNTGGCQCSDISLQDGNSGRVQCILAFQWVWYFQAKMLANVWLQSRENSGAMCLQQGNMFASLIIKNCCSSSVSKFLLRQEEICKERRIVLFLPGLWWRNLWRACTPGW